MGVGPAECRVHRPAQRRPPIREVEVHTSTLTAMADGSRGTRQETVDKVADANAANPRPCRVIRERQQQAREARSARLGGSVV